MENILVTGGAGFIGINLCKKLLTEGHNIFCMDNFYSSERSNISHLSQNENFTFIEHSIINEIILDAQINCIYHLACPASPVFYQKDNIYTLDTCYIGTRNVLEFAKRKSARVLFTSTSEVYGDPLVHPQPESYFGNVNTLGPRSCYDEGKRVAESLMHSYMKKYNLDIRLVRIFNTYGPYMHSNDGRVVSNFIVNTLAGRPVTIYGDGQQTRSFCYVSDLVEGIICNMNASEYFGPINLGNPQEVTLLELLEEIQNILGTNIEPIYKKARVDDPVKRKPVINKARLHLNWFPKIDLKVGLEHAIDFYK